MKNKLSSPLTDNAIVYAWRQLAQRAKITEIASTATQLNALGIPVYYARPVELQPEQPSIIIAPCADAAWCQLLARPHQDLDWLPIVNIAPDGSTIRFAESIPVLFWGEGYEQGEYPFAQQRDDGTIVFYADIIAATFFMLSRWEETVTSQRDRHERFPATASVSYQQGFLDRPIVDEYALILQAWLKRLVPQWSPATGEFSVKLSHDIDFVSFTSFCKATTSIYKGQSIKQLWRERPHLAWRDDDTYLRSCYELAEVSETNGFRSAFYFMTAQRQIFDNGYDIRDKAVRNCIDSLRERGHEIGFHPGYHTVGKTAQFMNEKSRMDAYLGEEPYGGRQHYLRFHVPDTWQQWAAAGLAYDSTVGYADHEGFRCGTCHPFYPFDIKEDHQLDLLEIPLIAMDTTLKSYQKLTPEQSAKRILALAKRSKEVHGVFTLLWHNTSLYGAWQAWGNMYHRIVAHLAELKESSS